jgi:hypothetical protein
MHALAALQFVIVPGLSLSGRERREGLACVEISGAAVSPSPPRPEGLGEGLATARQKGRAGISNKSHS